MTSGNVGAPETRHRAPIPSDYRNLSFWFDSLVTSGADDLTPRDSLVGDQDCDVVIVGGGLTGLWTAYYLTEIEPSTRISILEREIVGFGASGRNGGWCSALFPASATSLERRHGRAAALAMRRAMIATVDEVGRVTEVENIDCDYAKGGTVEFAKNALEMTSARAAVQEAHEFGVDELELWDADRTPVGIGAVFDPACARLHPAKLVRGLARILEQRGVVIYEQSGVTEIAPRRGSDSPRVQTATGSVRSENVVIATEGYGTPGNPRDRSILPLYSLMIATEPLSDEQWRDIGIGHGQTFSDFRHLLIYGQRTADNRFAFGGRGARYHWGSSIRSTYDRVPRVFDHLERTLHELFPAARDAGVTHRWGGPLGVPRDWHASVTHSTESGIARAGGYVGDGLSTTNLAGRTLADLISRRETALTELPWVGHRSPRWEPEPLRFIGSNLGLAAMGIADTEERLTGRPSIAARLMGPLVGH